MPGGSESFPWIYIRQGESHRQARRRRDPPQPSPGGAQSAAGVTLNFAGGQALPRRGEPRDHSDPRRGQRRVPNPSARPSSSAPPPPTPPRGRRQPRSPRPKWGRLSRSEGAIAALRRRGGEGGGRVGGGERRPRRGRGIPLAPTWSGRL